MSAAKSVGNGTDSRQELIGAVLVNEEDDIMVINEKGLVIRTKVNSIRKMGRAATGVSIMKSEENEKMASITKINDKTIE